MKQTAWRLAALLLLCLLAWQLALGLRIGLMRWVDPQSTTFQRSEALRLLKETPGRPKFPDPPLGAGSAQPSAGGAQKQSAQPAWSQQWVPYAGISNHLKRAVIASEDAGFTDHAGVEWDAIEAAWEKNQRAEARASAQAPRAGQAARVPKVVGGSTITQQLAKNLFLSGERTTLRKAQELVITFWLEALLPKQRLLEIYLNNVEWGEGVFGAQAAARHYFRKDASRLGPEEAARLAVMLPAPKRFEKRPGSAYVVQRAATIQARMGAVELP
jgi:monofunctional biosynthetic peptidoglycan transglycosylase